MEIISNGSKWAGEKPDTIERLMEVLQEYILDPRFDEERFGRFCYQLSTGVFHALGNLLDRSHVFSIRGTLDELLPLAQRIKENTRPAYQRAFAQMYR